MSKIIEFVPKKKYRIVWSIDVADDLPPCKIFLHMPNDAQDYIRVKLCVNSFDGIQRAKEQALRELKGEYRYNYESL